MVLFQWLLDPSDEDADLADELRHQLKKIVNKRDLLGNTALHLATQKWTQDIVKLLLRLGANVGKLHCIT